MIRFVIRRVRRDGETGLASDSYFTIDDDVQELERVLRLGGFSESGYDTCSLLGVELIEKPREEGK
jgi:hypothetical protein